MAEFCLHGRYAKVPETLIFVGVHPEGSGALSTAAEQAAFVNPATTEHYRWTRFALLRAYFEIILRAELSADQRARCLGALFCYMFQLRKWARVFRSMVHGTGVGGANVEILRSMEDTSQVAPSATVKTSKPTKE